MTSQEHFQSLLWLADDALILGQRLGAWCGHGPVLEEDIALSNVALDLIGQARAFLTHAGEIEGNGRDEDALAYFRTDAEYRNLLLVEQPNGHFGDTIVRQFLFDQFALIRYDHLANQSFDARCAAIASKALKEVRYHAAHSSQWIRRLGDGTVESHDRVQESLHRLWGYSGECFEDNDIATAAAQSGLFPSAEVMETRWLEAVSPVLTEVHLEIPSESWMHSGGRHGTHTEHLSYMLAEMQVLPRTYPDAQW